MSISQNTQQSIIAAWNNINPWVQNNLPALAQGSTIPNYSYQAATGVCPLLDSAAVSAALAALGLLTGGLSELLEGDLVDDGDGTMNLTSMAVTSLSGTSTGTPAFNGSTVTLSLPFTTLQVGGSFNYVQKCKREDLGFIPMGSFDTKGNGNMTLTSSGQQINYTCNIDSNNTVSIVSAVVTGSIQAKATAVHEPKTPIGDLANAIDNALGNNGIVQALGAAFTAASFSNDLINELNTAITAAMAPVPG